MASPDFDRFDHDAHMSRAIELAREAVERGDRPFGSVLVRDDEIVMEASNRVLTEDDIRRHPELHLAHRATRELDPTARAETVMYTSTEPCPMCAGGMCQAGFGRVVYSVSGDELREFTGGESTVDSATILDGITDVVGGIKADDGRRLHAEFFGSG
ncbi:nucleoside deaminase [Salinibaculum rarum]|uniref:nucleoside deaminase n=1 Tax=Salinibaculum rarum TaxID=3058903 RepID=UPI00265FE9AE|nr:nucleoside deaminase [Salinibaculum sp. KK48]